MNSFKRKVNYDKYENEKKPNLIKENEENEDPHISHTEIDSYLRSFKEVKKTVRELDLGEELFL